MLPAIPVRPALDSEHSEQLGRVLPVRSVEELLKDESLAGEVEWVVEGLIPVGGLSIVYGLPKAGKGTLVTHLARCVVAEESFLDKVVKCGNVLWIDLEQHERLTRRKFAEEGAFNKFAQIFTYNGLPPLLMDLEATIVAKGIVLVVLDSLSRFLMLEDENDAAKVTAGLAPIVDLIHRRNVGFIAVHHSRKSEGEFGSGMRGSSAFLAVSDVAVHVKRLHAADDEDDGRRRLVCVSRYDEANETLTVQRVDTEYVVEDSPEVKRQNSLIGLLANGPLEEAEIVHRLKRGRSRIRSDLARLVASGQLRRLGSGTRAEPFRYSV